MPWEWQLHFMKLRLLSEVIYRNGGLFHSNYIYKSRRNILRNLKYTIVICLHTGNSNKTFNFHILVYKSVTRGSHKEDTACFASYFCHTWRKIHVIIKRIMIKSFWNYNKVGVHNYKLRTFMEKSHFWEANCPPASL